MIIKMPQKEYKNPQDLRNKSVHLAFSENEIADLDKYREKTTRTQFIRQALNDKYIRIEHPEMFGGGSSSSNNENVLELLNKINISNDDIKKFLKTTLVKEINKTLKVLKTMVNEPIVEKNKEIVINILKEHGKLRVPKLMELSNLRNHEFYDVISDDSLFSLSPKNEIEYINSEEDESDE